MEEKKDRTDVTGKAGAQDRTERNLELSPEHLFSIGKHEMFTDLSMISGAVILTLKNVSDRIANMEQGNRDYTLLQSVVEWMHSAQTHVNNIELQLRNLQGVQQIQVNLWKVELVALLKTLVTDYQLTGRSVKLSLPDPHQPILVRADRLRVTQIVLNLLNNAAKYGAEPFAITVETLENAARVSVIDAGPGIPAEKEPEIWELFGRLDPLSRQEGSGIGLYLCKELVRLHNGSIGVENPTGGGARFWFTLPLLDKAESK